MRFPFPMPGGPTGRGKKSPGGTVSSPCGLSSVIPSWRAAVPPEKKRYGGYPAYRTINNAWLRKAIAPSTGSRILEGGADIDAMNKSLTAMDVVVYGLILGLGVLQFSLYQRSDDFFGGDTVYFELARSIVERGSYGFNFKSETMFPPGFPAILALICITVGCSYAVLIRSMAVFTALGFIVSYELLR